MDNMDEKLLTSTASQQAGSMAAHIGSRDSKSRSSSEMAVPVRPESVNLLNSFATHSILTVDSFKPTYVSFKMLIL